MSRSVSTPSGAEAIGYAYCEDLEDFDFYVDYLRSVCMKRYPSLSVCNRWIGREDRAVLENRHAYVTVSEYCGLIAVCTVPKNQDSKSTAWASNFDTDKAAQCFGELLVSQGYASNGEQFFRYL